jgi:hypothetical protein
MNQQSLQGLSPSDQQELMQKLETVQMKDTMQ